MTPLLNDRTRPETDPDNLDGPTTGGRAHTRRGSPGKPFSVYTSATTHPGLAAAAAIAAGLALAAALRVRHARRRRPAGWLDARRDELEALGRRLRR